MVIFGGDRLKPAYLQPWAAVYAPERLALINMYGITETTVHVSYHRLTAADIAAPSGCSPVRTQPDRAAVARDNDRHPQFPAPAAAE
jgi:non-ribosomal peptide synthetase component F